MELLLSVLVVVTSICVLGLIAFFIGMHVIPFLQKELETARWKRIQDKYDYVGYFTEDGLAHVNKGGKWFHIRRNGKAAYKRRYDSVGYFQKGLASACEAGEYFHIRLNGEPAYDERYDYVGAFREGTAEAEKDGETFRINRSGVRVE